MEESIGLNNGKVLMHLAKNTYHTLRQVIVEGVQNAIDAGAQEIWIRVDIKRRQIHVANDGSGVDIPLFTKALNSVGLGVKAEEKLGRFGLGLISALDKCEYFTFTSKPEEETKWLQWEFRAGNIEPQSNEVRIPRRRVGREKMKGWLFATTVLAIHKFTEDRTTSALDPGVLTTSIQEKLGPALHKSGVTCHLEFIAKDGTVTKQTVKPLEYSGDPLPLWMTHETDAGEVECELYLSRRTAAGRQGRVVFSEMEDTYPITLLEFAKQAQEWLSREVREVLNSGIFEGIIRAENIELHSSRSKFVWNDAVAGLCVAIEKWLEDVGREVYVNERAEHEEHRLQELCLKTLGRLDDLLRDESFAPLLDALRRADYGTIGVGHVPPGQRTREKLNEPGLRVGQGGVGQQHESNADTSPPKEGPRDPEREGDRPLVALGPRGQRRQLVRHGSTGLQLSLAMPEGSDRLWEFDVAHGVVYLNTRHPVWVNCEDKDHYLLHLQEWIILQALGLLLQPDTAHPVIMQFTDDQARAYAELMIRKGHLRNRNKK